MSSLANPTTIAVLFALAVGVFVYGILVPKTRDVYSPTATTSDNTLLKLAAILGGELYSSLPEQASYSGRAAHPRLESLLQRSGNPWKFTAPEFQFFQITTAFIGFILGGVAAFALSFSPITVPWWIVMPLTTVLGYFFPYIKYRDLANQRDLDFKRQLPEALDLIMISLTGGVPFAQAVRESIPNMKDGVLKEEFQEIVRQMDSGRTVNEALEFFGNRSPSESIRTFVHAVREANKLDVPLTEVLESRAEASREEYFALIESKIASLPSKLLVVLTPTLLPALFLVVLAPALLSLVKVL